MHIQEIKKQRQHHFMYVLVNTLEEYLFVLDIARKEYNVCMLTNDGKEFPYLIFFRNDDNKGVEFCSDAYASEQTASTINTITFQQFKDSNS